MQMSRTSHFIRRLLNTVSGLYHHIEETRSTHLISHHYHNEGALTVSGSFLQGNCSPIAVSQLSWYMWYPRTIASMLNISVAISASQLVSTRHNNLTMQTGVSLYTTSIIGCAVATSEWEWLNTILNLWKLFPWNCQPMKTLRLENLAL